MANDYYNILGVNRNASAAEIKQAFRKLAHQHHPDKAGGDEKKFKEINEAYQVLSNPQKRAQYDQFGQTFNQGQGGFSDFSSAFRQGGNQNFSFEFGDLGDLFGDFFGGRGQTKQQARVGSDIEVDVALAFKEAVFGIKKDINFDHEAICSRCSGQGSEPGSKLVTCSTCRGTGQIMRQAGFGISFRGTCTTCQGQGQQAEKPCTTCQGSGTTKTKSSIAVAIPAGINTGQSIRLSGKGQAIGKGGRPGDLYIRVTVTPDAEFARQGYDIVSTRKIQFSQAALGDKIEVATVDGSVKLKIPEGTQSGKVFRLRGRGVPHLQGRGRGDHLVRVTVETPSHLNRKQKQLLKDLEQTGL